MIGLCAKKAQGQPNYMTTLNDVECVLQFEEGTLIMDINRSLDKNENWLGMLGIGMMHNFKILVTEHNYSDSMLTASETWEDIRSWIGGALQQVMNQLIQMIKQR